MRKLLFPFSILYWFIISIRNYFYKNGWLKSFEFDFPIICVGNLNTGGTGKTPHLQYLIQILKGKYEIATLSRGYKRKLKGFATSTELSLVEDIGDEPKLLKQKFPEIHVCVSEDRVMGVYQLLQENEHTKVILMDDGLQHRRIKPGLQILLTSYSDLFISDFILPVGNLREPKSEYKRMQIILITKCNQLLLQQDADSIEQKIKLQKGQHLFFTSEIYEAIKPMFTMQKEKEMISNQACILVSGIAHNQTLIAQLKQHFSKVDVLRFPDHHYFTEQNLNQIKNRAAGKTIITTEKDAMRLMENEELILQLGLSFFILPISIQFLFNQQNKFDSLVFSYIENTLTQMQQEP